MASAEPPIDAGESASGVRIGPWIVAGMVAVSLIAAWAILHDAGTTSAVMSVPSETAAPRPANAAAALRDTLAFVPSSAPYSIAQAIAAATGAKAAGLAADTTVTRAPGGTWIVDVRVPVDEQTLLRAGTIFTGVGQGASNLKTGLLQVTSDQTQFVLHVTPTTGSALFAFRLSASGATLSSTDWNANTVLSQTQVGDEDIP